jgi:hypothetical protein
MTPISRRGLLARRRRRSLLAALQSHAGRHPLVTPSRTSPTGSVRNRSCRRSWSSTPNTDLLGVSVRDRRTGAGTFAFRRGDFDTQSASIAKVMIVLLALNKARERGRGAELRGLRPRVAGDHRLRERPRRRAVGVGGGRDAYTALARELGPAQHARATTAASSGPGRNTTPDDQRKLADLLVRGHPGRRRRGPPLPARPDVEDQRRARRGAWATTASAASCACSMKNGWVQFKSMDNLWGVNSMGHVQGEGRDYVAAIMTRMPTFDEGRAWWTPSAPTCSASWRASSSGRTGSVGDRATLLRPPGTVKPAAPTRRRTCQVAWGEQGSRPAGQDTLQISVRSSVRRSSLKVRVGLRGRLRHHGLGRSDGPGSTRARGPLQWRRRATSPGGRRPLGRRAGLRLPFPSLGLSRPWDGRSLTVAGSGRGRA